MWYCFYEQDIGIDNFEGQGSANNNLNELRTGKSGLIYVIYMKVKNSQALNAAILRGLHFTSSHKQWKTMKRNPLQTPAWEAEKSCAEVCYDILVWAHARHTVFTLYCCLHCNPLVISGQSEL